MSKALQSPIPTIGELLKYFAYAFSHVNADHTKQLKVTLGRMAKGRDMEPDKVNQFITGNLSQLFAKDPKFSHHIREALDEGLEVYCDLIRTTDFSGLTREQTAPALFVHIFAPIAVDIFQEIAKHNIAPNLKNWTDATISPTAAVVQWWLDHNHLTAPAFANQIVPLWEGLNQKREAKSLEEALYGWLNQTQLISVQMAMNFYDGKNNAFARWLLLARAWETYWQNLPVNQVERFRKVWRARLSARPSELDLQSLQVELGRIISQDKRHEAFLYMLEEAKEIKVLCGLQTRKKPGDAARTISLLERLENQNPLPELPWQFATQQARHHVLMGEHSEALRFYSDAFETARYRNGNLAKQLLSELLIIEAFLGKTKQTNKWRGWAKFLGLTPNVENALHAYFSRFPLNNHYPEANFEKLQRKHEQRPTGIICTEEWDDKPPDYRYPNRNVAGFGPIPKPQLLIYATLNKPSVIKKLLEKGAETNQIADDGGSALLCAIQAKAHECIDLLLPLTSPMTINTATRKRNFTPLGVAIDHGDPCLVERLLSSGADPNLRYGELNLSPLYNAVQGCSTLSPISENSLNNEAMEIALNQMPASMRPNISSFREDQIEAMRNQIAASLQNPRHRAIFKEMADHYFSGEGVSLSDRRQIVSLLLRANTNVNETHDQLHGFTPFLLATELGLLEVYQMLHIFGGDLRSTTNQNQTTLHLACWKGHYELAKLILTLASMQDRQFLINEAETYSGSKPVDWVMRHRMPEDPEAMILLEMILGLGNDQNAHSH